MTDKTFEVIENEWIPLADGTRLAARIWMPGASKFDQVPAILEFLPYRKRDGTAQRDESTYPVFAAAGYAGVRVDMRGSGESEGVIDGEYSEQELSDACEVIEWIAAQAWCTGSVGMMGISWGGFNALQVAALRPEPLKAVISIASTVDRYNDDIHYKGGCQLAANLSWAATVACYQSRPPDPALVGDRWREMWLKRLEDEPLMLEDWLAHQRRDAFWKHGSICEDFQAVEIPALVIAGWADGYRNTPLKAVEGLGARAKAIIGPWIHKYPHFAWPQPRADFHAEAIRWWDRWLKGRSNGADDLPQVRAYLLDGPKPAPRREHDPGRWVAIETWRVPARLELFAGAHRGLAREKADADLGTVLIDCPQDTGVTAGEYFTLKPDAEMAGDQRADDGRSVTFETEPLDAAVEVLGRPVLTLRVETRDPQNLAARLVDVHPDGSATRVSFGVLNLAHRDGDEEPAAMPEGEAVTITLELDACGYRFAAGHRISLSLSNAYWPMIWPAPGTGGITAHPSSLELGLPLLDEAARPVEVPEPANPDPLPQYIERWPPASRRTVERNLTSNVTTSRILEDTGAFEHPDTGLTTRQVRREAWTVDPDDPLTARGETHWTAEMSREGWRIRTESYLTLSCTSAHWIIQGTVVAYEGESEVHRKNWDRQIPRDLM
ncbi:CocE/NonD family hydrolase [Lutibaculum baratangense]|uniref:Glutaryl 7-ACA acylase n=1 Tax=Lutibaculum baratangense AMV1 TaxID=631454 RepID=V4RLR4_9HYPH|nr:CocE/NonD family hydrolase [Lutibaculum baratangense]ESR26961.1 glutaryl 7-ACA acylase precursor [Lutibaculum baratangense AMV1]